MTLALDGSNLPGGSLQSRVSNYYMATTITNTTSGDALTITLSTTVDLTITLDCENKVATLADGTEVTDAISWNSKRACWLDFQKGSNTLQIDDAGLSNMDVVITYRARMAG